MGLSKGINVEETLQHDPRTKQQMKDLLYQYLYAPIDKQLQLQLDRIITKNAVYIGASHNSFMYKGVFYSCDSSKPPRKMNQLALPFRNDMDNYLKEVKHLNTTEIPYVVGFITQVLNSSNDLQDYLRVFPEAIHRPIEALINSYPCRSKKLTDFDVECIRKKNQASIDLMRQRMVTNLLI